MNKKTELIVSPTETMGVETEKGMFITKMVGITFIENALVGKKQVKQTLYLSAPKSHLEGTKITLDLTEWNVEEHEGKIPDSAEKDAGKPIKMKWLHFKAGVIPTVTIELPKVSKEKV